MTLRRRFAAGSRRGLTLLEVVVALIIFVGGVAALYQLIQTGSYRAARVEQKSQASLRCQSKLDEVLVGAEALSSTDYQSFPDNDKWLWRLNAVEELDGLYKVQVDVKRELPNGDIIESSLVRYMVPPSRRGSSLDAFGALPTAPATGSGTTPPTESTPPATGGTTPPTTGGTTPPPGGGTAPAPATPPGGGATKGATKGGTKG